MKIYNPATEELITELQEDSEDSVHESFESLTNGQKEWAFQSIDHRINCIKKFGKLLLENIDDLSEVLTSEVGKPLNQSVNELKGAADRISYFVENSKPILSERIAYEDVGIIEKVTFEPLGVIANISAWNYPYLVGVNVFIPALIAGNSVMYKPSELSSLTGLEIEKLMREAGVVDTVFKSVIGGGEVGQLLLDLPLSGYFFTGSQKTGSYIYREVAKKMIPCQMELGGKDPLYVSSHNSDLQSVAQAAAEGVFYNNGQSCCAVERIYVHTEVYKEFVQEFVKEVTSYRMGSPLEGDVFIGPVTRKDQLNILTNQVVDAIEKGAKLEMGGKVVDTKGYYFEPTVLTDVTNEMLLMNEESFGPVIGICVVKDWEEAVAYINDTEYGLTTSIYTESQEEFNRMGRKINSGTVYRNCCDRVSANLPWSGRKGSGFGSTLSEEGIKAFVKPKSWQIKS